MELAALCLTLVAIVLWAGISTRAAVISSQASHNRNIDPRSGLKINKGDEKLGNQRRSSANDGRGEAGRQGEAR